MNNLLSSYSLIFNSPAVGATVRLPPLPLTQPVHTTGSITMAVVCLNTLNHWDMRDKPHTTLLKGLHKVFPFTKVINNWYPNNLFSI